MPIDDDELLNDEEPRSQSRPSYAGASPVSAKSVLTTAAATEQKLRDLLRTAQFFSASIRHACEATSDLSAELESLDGTLDGHALSFRALMERARELECALLLSEDRAEKERRRLLEEQDAFIVSLVSEHERALKRAEARAEAAENQLAALRAAPEPPAER